MSSTIARLPVDPDLSRALIELSHPVRRLAEIEAQLVTDTGRVRYHQYGSLIHQKDGIWSAITSQADRLNLKPAALRLFVEENDRLRAITGRRPHLGQLQRAVIASRDALLRSKVQRQAAAAEAAFHAKHAEHAVDTADAGIEYLEKCCG